MRHRRVHDVMTPAVVCAPPAARGPELARLLADNHVRALPVVSDGRPVGMVTEGDLMRGSSRPAVPGGRPALPGPGTATAEQLMSTPAVVARPDWSIVQAARVMRRHGVKRLPVVDAEGLVTGIVSRGDLLRVFLRRDHAIETEIIQDVLTGTLGLPPATVSADVHRGRVTLRGTIDRRSMVPVVERLCRGVDGVVAVANHLEYTRDDTDAASPAAR
ncbi:CBS domain-containing protein [Streptomyces sodiiphilus]|uniref:CBS domain-containing protein n=1 Tax=Streptomyces sodiiphilus TaxID=226217 RepID=A0ABN2P7P9_9ACTN